MTYPAQRGMTRYTTIVFNLLKLIRFGTCTIQACFPPPWLHLPSYLIHHSSHTPQWIPRIAGHVIPRIAGYGIPRVAGFAC